MGVLIKEITRIDSEGVAFKLTGKASLDKSGFAADQWYLSWDKIGRVLFKGQYSNANTVRELRIERGDNE
jgi:hypothetical protein